MYESKSLLLAGLKASRRPELELRYFFKQTGRNVPVAFSCRVRGLHLTNAWVKTSVSAPVWVSAGGTSSQRMQGKPLPYLARATGRSLMVPSVYAGLSLFSDLIMLC